MGQQCEGDKRKLWLIDAPCPASGGLMRKGLLPFLRKQWPHGILRSCLKGQGTNFVRTSLLLTSPKEWTQKPLTNGLVPKWLHFLHVHTHTHSPKPEKLTWFPYIPGRLWFLGFNSVIRNSKNSNVLPLSVFTNYNPILDNCQRTDKNVSFPFFFKLTYSLKRFGAPIAMH